MTATTPLSVETPSGKDAAYENFPVGSWLLPARLRPHIAVFYGFARAIDDIADNPDLEPADKVARLDGFEDVLLGRGADDPAYVKAIRMRAVLEEASVTPKHCVDLIAAFKQDATKLRYKDWDDLIGYCVLSAAPVGRFLLDLHGGSRDGYGPSDALCIALQIINHTQDCQDDYRKLNRVYLPLDWIEAEGTTVEAFEETVTVPAMRRVFDRTLAGVDDLMVEARRLPAGLHNRRLAMESAVIIEIAERLTVLLKRGDPLTRRIQLTKAGFLWCALRGVAAVIF